MRTCNALLRLYFSQWGAGRNQRIESLGLSQSPESFLVAMKPKGSKAIYAHSVAKKIVEEGIHKEYDHLDAIQQSGLVGTTYQHYGNHKLYVLTDFIWDSETDEWKVVYERHDPLDADRMFVRSFANAFGDVLLGSMPVRRFEQLVTGDAL